MTMTSLPKHLRLPGFFEKAGIWIGHNLNFYRVHMISFGTIPLIISGILYAANTTHHIKYIDCLFVCMSCMCVTGLSTIDLSMLSTFQQFLLYFQMIIGSMMFVSIIMISVRKYFFRLQFRHVLHERSKKTRALDLAKTITQFPGQTTTHLRRRFTRRPDAAQMEMEVDTPPIKKKKGPHKLTKDMIHRVDGGGVGLINPMGWYDGATPTASQPPSRAVSPDPGVKPKDVHVDESEHKPLNPLERSASKPSVRSQGFGSKRGGDANAGSESSDTGSSTSFVKTSAYQGGSELRQVLTTDSLPPAPARANTEPLSSVRTSRTPYSAGPVPEEHFPRSKTIAFDDTEDGLEHVLHPGHQGERMSRVATTQTDGTGFHRTPTSETTYPRTNTLRRTQSRFVEAKSTGFGGFPTPLALVSDFAKRFVPGAQRLEDTLTMPRTNTLSGRQDNGPGKNVDYISFAATVGRNSLFHNLTDEQMDELGGVEYRALRMLFWIVLSYWLFFPLAAVTIIAPYINAGHRYADVFKNQPGPVGVPWFAFFQATSAFSNTGMSLVDMSMLPFPHAYIMSIVMCMLILLGNTCFPIALRFFIWCLWKMVPERSQSRETLKFLLDHPRRCFVYLFPSTQTWFLLFVVLTLTAIDWVGFIVLDLGTPVIEALRPGERVADGLFQSIAVRAAGFAWIPMNSVAPAVKVLYVIMMYVSVYPIAMSVRSTNVYEERALGVFHDAEDSDDEDEQEHLAGKEHGAQAVAKYLGWHARRQLAFDMWWVALALWLICIIERGQLNKPENYEWMNIFNILFEIVSAYGTVGLSLGVPMDNYSLSGQFRTLSKLIIIVVMLRGRHRGLPVAIDRAVMLPKDFSESDAREMESRLRRSRSRRASSMAPDMFSVGSVFPRTTTMASEAPRLPSREHRDSQPHDASPASHVRRLGRTTSHGSISDPAAPGSPQVVSSPTSLQFALSPVPRQQASTMSFNSMGSGSAGSPSLGLSPTMFTGSGFPSSSQHPNHGILSPVQEDLNSRRPTLTAEPATLANSVAAVTAADAASHPSSANESADSAPTAGQGSTEGPTATTTPVDGSP